MLARDLYRIASSETDAIRYLQSHDIISKEKECPKCKKIMSADLKRARWRCRKGKCNVQISMRSENGLFVRSGLSICKTLELLWIFLYSRMTIREVSNVTDISITTIILYYRRFRHVCTLSLSIQPKMIGTDTDSVQVDESFFSGRRKYNRGRPLAGDKKNKKAQEKPNVDDEYVDTAADWNEEKFDKAKDGIDDPNWCWVVGIYSSKTCVRFFRVGNRTGDTLISLIEKYVEAGSVVHTDEWKGYIRLPRHGYTHGTVCHKKHYVDRKTGVHTQGGERWWRTVKLRLRCGVGNRSYQQSHLDEVAWQMMHSEDLAKTLIISFLDDVKTHLGK